VLKNLFTKNDVAEILQRIENLKTDSQHNWGKMNVSQMLAHCASSMEVAAGQRNLKRTLMGKLIGGFFKPMFTNEKPFSKNGPTDKNFKITDEKNFEVEKQRLKNIIQQFHEGGSGKCTTHPHSFFGKVTPEEWSIGMYKHLDHHLRQFGA
jgi:hypothetical protein